MLLHTIDLTNALSRLVRDRGGNINHILVEASGLADPGPVAASFWLDDELEGRLRLDAVVAVVDPLNIKRHLGDPGDDPKARLAQKQIAVADVVILNKRDLVEEAEFGKLRLAVTALHPSERVLTGTKCDVDLHAILNICAYDAAVAKRDAELFAGHVSHVPTGAVSLTIAFEDVYFDESALNRSLGTLLWEERSGAEIWGMKALIFIAGDQYLRLYQGVHTLFEDEEADVTVSDKDGVKSCFIFIGRESPDRDPLLTYRSGLPSPKIQ